MRSVVWIGVLAVTAACLLSFGAGQASAQSGFDLVLGKAFDAGLVRDFYLEGNSIPTQKRNAAMIKSTTGKRLVFALLDTSGYGTDVQQKYLGMAIVEQKVALGGAELAVGAYGFGIEKATGEGPARILFYDVAGQKVAEATAQLDKDLKQPLPLQVIVTEDQFARLYLRRIAVGKDQPPRLYLGKHWLAIK
jgi:hypothetical protein